MGDFDITTLILSEHEQFRRTFAEIEQLTDPEEVGRRWRELADSLEVHAAGEEEVFYPELLQDVDDSEEENDVLPPFQEQVSAEQRDALGMRWLEFHERHEDAKGLSGDTVDPQAYVEEHSAP